jgi:hypothetical protein
MNRFSRPLALLCLSLVIAVGSPAHAAPAVNPEIDRLGQLLRLVGCTPEPIRGDGDAVIGFTAEYKSADSQRAFRFRALPTADGFTVWFKVRLAQVTELRGVPAEIFIKLLATNAEISPAFFVYSDDESSLYLYTSTYAAGLTPETLRAQLETLHEKANKTAGVWNPKYWPTGRAAPLKPAS